MRSILLAPPPPVGLRLPRTDGHDKVVGAARYPDDLRIPDAFVGKVLRSPHPHARIRRIDTTQARAVTGVGAVLTAADVPCNEFGLVINDQPVLAADVVRYLGEAVALVAAQDEQAAARALSLIQVDYEPLPGVFNPHEALRPGAPLVHPDRRTNLLSCVKVRKGDWQGAWERADAVVAHEYQTQFIDHAFMQPESATAIPVPNGRITVYVASQWPHDDRRQIAHALNIPVERVRVIETVVGGAFGGREDMSVQILVALLAVRTGQPVRLTYSRTESLVSHGKRHPFSIRHRLGATREGVLVAADIEIVGDGGAYASTSEGILTNACTFASGPYDIPNIRIDGYAAYTNNVFTCAMRGFGAPQVAFAAEQQMDRLAAVLGLDPLELRRRNCWVPGSRTAMGQVLSGNVTIHDTIERAAEASDWQARKASGRAQPSGPRRRGIGMACGVKNVGKGNGYRDRAEARVCLWEGRAEVYVGCTEVGQGSNTMIAQVAAAELDLPVEGVRVCTEDTDQAPDAGSSSASRQTLVSGNAVRLACAQAKRVARFRGLPSPADPPIKASAVYEVPLTERPDPETGQGNTRHVLGGATQVVEVEVDVETGEVEVTRAVSVHDAGVPINPTLLEGQIEGGLVMGLGQALTEEFLIQDGKPVTTGFVSYLMPSLLDVPQQIVSITIPSYEAEGPFGAKGVAEMANVPIMAAVANAVYDATGAWVDTLPLSPERVRAAIKQQRGERIRADDSL